VNAIAHGARFTGEMWWDHPPGPGDKLREFALFPDRLFFDVEADGRAYSGTLTLQHGQYSGSFTFPGGSGEAACTLAEDKGAYRLAGTWHQSGKILPWQAVLEPAVSEFAPEIDRLRALAKRLISQQLLPATTNPDSVVARHVVKKAGPCALCGKPIEAGQSRYEISHASPVAIGSKMYSLHFLCHAAWQIESAGAEQKGPPSERARQPLPRF
jgi:hypothetical protein